MSEAATNPDTITDVAQSSNPSWFSRKLESLVRGRVKTELDEAANLKKGTISLILHRGNMAYPTEGFAIARALGVCPLWLLDEEDTRLEPVMNSGQPRLADADDEQLIESIRERYAAAAMTALNSIETIGGISNYEPHHWQYRAIDLLIQQSPEDVKRSIHMVEECMRAMSRVHRLWAFAGLDHGYFLSQYVDDIFITSEDDLKYPELSKRWQTEVDSSLGLKLLTVFINAMAASRLEGDDEVRAQHFYQRIAPIFLANIITDWTTEEHPRRDEILSSLQKKGYITEDGKPMDIPDFIAWHPDDDLALLPRKEEKKTKKNKRK